MYAFRTLLQKLSAVYFLLLAVSITVISFSNLTSSVNYLERQISDQMLAHANLLEISLPQTDTSMQHLVSAFKKATGARFTIIASDGNVLADTDENPAIMENHLTRPEVRQARERGVGMSTRFSTTTKSETRYVAKVIATGSVDGYVRIAFPMEAVKRLKSDITRKNLLITIVVALLTGLVVYWYLRNLIRPIREISAASRKIASGDFSRQLKVRGAEELQELTNSFNKMAIDLSKLMHKLTSERQRIEAILVSMVDGIIVCDRTGLVSLINPAAEQIFGIIGEQAINRPFLEVIRNYELADAFEHALKTAEPSKEELRLFSPQELTVLVQVTPVHDADGVVTGAVATIHDITTLRKLEQLRTEFVSNVSHELKTPLTSIKGFTETLLEEELDLPTQKRFLEIIYAETERLSRLIHDILDLSRLESQAARLSLNQVQIAEIVTGVAQLLSGQIEKKQITVQLDFAANFPAVEADSDMLAQVFLNLFENAVKYTPTGGKVTITGWSEENLVKISVSDTGIGIPARDLSRVFERFYRIDKARSRQAGGTGLGLAIVKHIIERHHGTISVQSHNRQGTTFLLSLPLTQEN